MLEGRIDLVKLKRDMKEQPRDSIKFVPAAAPQSAGSYGYSNSVEKITVLYALRSHLRGKLHMTRKEVVTGPPIYSGRAIYPVTMDDQEALIAQIWDEYKLQDENEEAA